MHAIRCRQSVRQIERKLKECCAYQEWMLRPEPDHETRAEITAVRLSFSSRNECQGSAHICPPRNQDETKLDRVLLWQSLRIVTMRMFVLAGFVTLTKRSADWRTHKGIFYGSTAKIFFSFSCLLRSRGEGRGWKREAASNLCFFPCVLHCWGCGAAEHNCTSSIWKQAQRAHVLCFHNGFVSLAQFAVLHLRNSSMNYESGDDRFEQESQTRQVQNHRDGWNSCLRFGILPNRPSPSLLRSQCRWFDVHSESSCLLPTARLAALQISHPPTRPPATNGTWHVRERKFASLREKGKAEKISMEFQTWASTLNHDRGKATRRRAKNIRRLEGMHKILSSVFGQTSERREGERKISNNPKAQLEFTVKKQRKKHSKADIFLGKLQPPPRCQLVLLFRTSRVCVVRLRRQSVVFTPPSSPGRKKLFRVKREKWKGKKRKNIFRSLRRSNKKKTRNNKKTVCVHVKGVFV